MKKSEMITLIANEIRAMALQGDGKSFLVMAEEILTAMESKGMKPPIKKRCPVLLRDEFFWEEE